MNIPSAQHLQQQIQKQFVTPDIERQRRELERAMAKARPYHFTHHGGLFNGLPDLLFPTFTRQSEFLCLDEFCHLSILAQTARLC